MLLAAGGFTVYRKETFFYDLARRFPNLTSSAYRRKFADEFLAGYLGKVPGLEVEPFVQAALARCRKTSAFLPLLMNGLTGAQAMDRWVEGTPVHVLYMNEIRQAIPDAIFVHVIRDGRDCAISNTSQRWIPTLPWDRSRRLGVAALFWEWMVRIGREYGRSHPADYLELRFEDLLADPTRVLNRVGAAIDHDLDYGRIRQNPVHSLKDPNTSFQDERWRADFNPVGRWKNRCSSGDLSLCEDLIGPYLHRLGYQLSDTSHASGHSARARTMRLVYLRYFSTKHWVKAHTPLGRLLTSPRIWAEQPDPDEETVHPVPSRRSAPDPTAARAVSRTIPAPSH